MKTLESAFQFTAEDLALNREGKISPRQFNRLQKFNISPKILIPFLIMLSGVCVFILPVSEADAVYFDLRTRFFTWVFLSLLFIPLVLIQHNSASKAIRPDMPVFAVEGEIRLRTDTPRTITYYFVQIGATELSITKEQYEALIEGKRYRAYYTRPIKWVLSVEELG
jgi:hypothetical protein